MSPLEFSICCGLIAWTARVVLMEPGGILHPYFCYLDRLAYRGRDWLARPLGLCSKCFAGQLALWGGLVYFSEGYARAPVSTLGLHVFVICLSVFTAYQLDRLKIPD